MEEMSSFGYWVRRRRKALDLTQAALAHKVGCATITIKKIEHGERRPSRTMAERLTESLMIPETERRAFISCGLGEISADALPFTFEITSQPSKNNSHAMLIDPAISERDRFVGRKRELVWLEKQLESAKGGAGRIAFIAGEAGRGKTALMAEFASQALAEHSDLLVSSGTCNAFAGTGDPYLPFREVIGLLTGEVGSGALSREKARRLRESLPMTLQALVKHGTHLIDVFVPGKKLLARAMTVASNGAAWITQLRAEVARRRKGVSSLEQSALFGEYTDVLHQLAEHHPLLIILDDLHWADVASLGLLFHLGRRLSGSRILILGAYRPEELAHGRDDERPPLEEVLGEFKRIYGEVWIDLDATDQAKGREFVDAILDSEPNRLGDAFRQALFQQTRGHPLFTVELLREMQSRGDLVQDRSGRWFEGEELDWGTLPARVEAVVSRRLDRLDEELWNMLAVGSVEGELFTAEVIAQVQGIPERLVLQALSQQLAGRHRLVRERGEIEVGEGYLSPYQFGHALFQQYLYQQLGTGERRRLHGEVAHALESLYEGQTDEIGVQLARHFEKAYIPEKAVAYLRRAGEKAMRLAANHEAIGLFTQALNLVKSLQASSGQILVELEILIELGEAHRKAGQFAESLGSFQQAAELALESRSPREMARAALGYEESRWRFDLPAEKSARLLEKTLELLDEGDSVLRVRVQVSLVRILMATSSPEQFTAMSQQMLETARRVNDPVALYDALYLKIRGDRRPEKSAERMENMNEMLQLAEEVGNREGVVDVLSFRMLEHLELGDTQSFQADQAILDSLSKRLQQPFYTYNRSIVQSMLALLDGRFEEAEQLAHQALEFGKQLHVENVDGVYGIQMFTIRREQGLLGEIIPVIKMFVEQNPADAAWRPGLALLYGDLGLVDEAQSEFDHLAEDDFAGIPQDSLWVTCIAYLAEVCAFLGDADRAATLYRLLLPFAGRTIVVGFMSICYGAASRYLGLLAATMSRWDEAEAHFQEALKMNARMGARPWLAHTQHQYAIRLLARGQTEDREKATSLLEEALKTAEELGMDSLTRKIEAINSQVTS